MVIDVSEASTVDTILNQAGEREKEYDWLGAAEFYKKVLNLVPETDSLKRGEIQERIGYAFYRAAMQAGTLEEFRDGIHDVVACCEKAGEFYAKVSEAGKTPRMLRCDAMIAFMRCWLTSGASEKKIQLDECWKLAKESLKAFEEAKESWEYGKTFNQLSTSALLAFHHDWDFKNREKTVREAVECGERTITLLSTFEDRLELVRAYVKTAKYLEMLGEYFPELDEQDRYHQKAESYWKKAKELSEETAMLESLSVLEGPSWDSKLGTDEALRNLEKALEYGKKTRDNFIVGCALDLLTYNTGWSVAVIEDPDERVELLKRTLQCAEDAKRKYSLIGFMSPRTGSVWVGSPHAECYFWSAYFVTNLKRKRDLLKKALEEAPSLQKLSDDSGYPETTEHVRRILSWIFTLSAKVEANPEEKKRLLEEALKYVNDSVKFTEQLEPFHYWNRGVMQNVLAEIRFELADLAKDSEAKKNLLQEAILDKETALKLCIKPVEFSERKGVPSAPSAMLGTFQFEYGDLLNRLHGFTSNREHLRRAAEAFEDAAKSFQKFDLTSRMAECYWKAAQVYGNLGEHLKAAESFNLASNNYKKSAENISQLKNLYEEHALYMQAWNEIERAKHHHAKQEYGLAKEHFEKAADLHKSLSQWSYLTPNYLAWVHVEHAEDLSRKEQSEEAIQAFQEAAKLFSEAKKSLQIEPSKIENQDERTMATSLFKASDLRREYCAGRIALEEAKILDKKGDHGSSCEKYGSAVEIFRKLIEALESEQDRKELKLIITLSQAWQRMTRAEAEDSPNLYIEASQFFNEAKELSPNEKAKMLASGHSRFCRALDAGTRFADTRDASLYAAAIQHLESAANYYVKAGFESAAEYAKATELLFDAYVHMDNAKKESDPEKKAKLYAMAEKILQTSAGSFMKAEHPEKREQVLRLLEKVKEERELALSLSEVLHAPAIVSTTTAFSTLTPTHENAVGLERFEHADIQVNLVTSQKELKVGESLKLEIELVNAGKGQALLTKITDVVPEGFELMEKPEMYRFEDSYLNMKGKRLDPLKMEELKLVLKPKVQGVFPLKPKILYLDEAGKYKSHEPEPVTITVKELGIKGWIKGER